MPTAAAPCHGSRLFWARKLSACRTNFYFYDLASPQFSSDNTLTRRAFRTEPRHDFQKRDLRLSFINSAKLQISSGSSDTIPRDVRQTSKGNSTSPNFLVKACLETWCRLASCVKNCIFAKIHNRIRHDIFNLKFHRQYD